MKRRVKRVNRVWGIPVLPENGTSAPAQVVLAQVIQAAEERLSQGARHLPYGQRVALERAHTHLYEALWWLNAADAAAGRIITP